MNTISKLTWLLLGFVGWSLVMRTIYTHNIIPQTPQNLDTEKASIQAMQSIYDILSEWYYDKEKLSFTGMRAGSIKWFVDAIQDPYTEYFTTEQNTDFMGALKWEEEFEGIGAAVAKKDEWVQIQEVFKGTPAAIAWLIPLDIVLEIDWEKTQNMTLTDAVKKIRGPKWSTVKLMVYRASEKDANKRVFTLEVTRNAVQIPSVSSEIIPLDSTDKKIWLISISIIGEETESLLQKEIATLVSANVQWIVLDLRWNGGGYLPKSVEIASHFIPKDKAVVTAKYSKHPTEKYMSKWYGQFENIPIVVLIDGLTASAWEVIAWALQQQRQATLVWVKTFGKWSIQTIADIGSGTALKYTIWKRYLPDDTNIDHEWIKPDIEVIFDREAYAKTALDNQKEKAIQVLKEKIQ